MVTSFDSAIDVISLQNLSQSNRKAREPEKMNSKTSNNIATGVIYFLVACVLAILVFLLGYILITGIPHVSWHFLTSAAQSFAAGGGIRDQLFNSMYLLVLTLIISFPIALGFWDLSFRIRP